MSVRRLEVYLDSYDTKPFIRDFVDSICLSTQDERSLEDWISMRVGQVVDIEKNLKIEDVRHRKPTQNLEATSLRVKLVQ